MTHRGDEGADSDVATFAAVAEACQGGLDDLVEGQPTFDVQLGCEPHLGVDDAVIGEILGAFGRNPVQGISGLHDAHGVGERLEVEDQIEAAGASDHPGGEFVRVMGGQFAVPVLLRQLDHGGWSDATVEVVVQQDLGRLAEFGGGGGSHTPA